MMKLFIVLLVGGICATQYQLWAGRASWFRLQEMRQTLAEQRAENDRLRARNDELSAELYSLEHNRDARRSEARRCGEDAAADLRKSGHQGRIGADVRAEECRPLPCAEKSACSEGARSAGVGEEKPD